MMSYQLIICWGGESGLTIHSFILAQWNPSLDIAVDTFQHPTPSSLPSYVQCIHSSAYDIPWVVLCVKINLSSNFS